MERTFNLSSTSDHYQLTVHFNNYDIHYGTGSFVKHYRIVSNVIPVWDIDNYSAMNVLKEHYGISIDTFLHDFLGYGRVA